VTKHRTRPCSNCPFLIEGGVRLHPERSAELIEAFEGDGHFHCHKTIDYSEGGGRVTGESQECAGSMILQVREQGQPSQLARVAERIGLLDGAELDRLAEDPNNEVGVFSCYDDFREANERGLRL